MDKDEVYQIWSKPQARWSRWVKPVLFAFMDGVFDVPPAPAIHFETRWVPSPGPVAIIVDMPREDGVLWGIQLARLGYQPIPLYNALPFAPNEKLSTPAMRSASTVDVRNTCEGGDPTTLTVKPPSFLRLLFYRIRIKFGLPRQLGGFGGMIPAASG